MIITTEPRDVPAINFASLSTKLLGEQLGSIPEIQFNSVDSCELACPYTEKVFANVGGEYWKNDKSSFLFKKIIASDTITIKLLKAGTVVATITDDTYGTYYGTFTAQPLYVGFVVEWEKVMNLEGAGSYTIEVDKVILGTPTTEISRCFFLSEYSDQAADKTIRIETYQNGNILSSQFDYTDLLPDGWYNSYRISGRLNTPDPKKETDNYLTQDYELKQIQDQIINEWELTTELLPSEITNNLLYEDMLANTFEVTDYSIFAHEIYRRVSLYPTEIEKVGEYTKNPNRAYKITLLDKEPNIIKRNF